MYSIGLLLRAIVHNMYMLYTANDGPVLHTFDLIQANIRTLLIYHKKKQLT